MFAAILQSIPLPYLDYSQTYLRIPATQGEESFGSPLPEEIDVPQVHDGELLSIEYKNSNVTAYLKNKTKFQIPVMESPYPLLWLEAKKHGEWLPIQFQVWPRCGYGVTHRLINPGTSAQTTIPLWPGDFKTEIRIGMFLARQQTTYSQPVTATINRNLFEFSPDRKGHYTIEFVGGIPVRQLIPTNRIRP